MDLLDDAENKINEIMSGLQDSVQNAVDKEVERVFTAWVTIDGYENYLEFLPGGKVRYTTAWSETKKEKVKTIDDMATDFIEREIKGEAFDSRQLVGISNTIKCLRLAADSIEKALNNELDQLSDAIGKMMKT